MVEQSALVKICCCCSVAQSCPMLCNPTDCSTGFPVLHCLPERTQTYFHWVDDAVRPYHPLSPPSPVLNLSQPQVKVGDINYKCIVQLLKCVWLFVTPWTAACQASLSFVVSLSLLKLVSTESVMPSTISTSVAPSPRALNLSWMHSIVKCLWSNIWWKKRSQNYIFVLIIL